MTVLAPASRRPNTAYDLWKRETSRIALFVLAITAIVSGIPVVFFPLYQVQTQDFFPLIILSVSVLVATFVLVPWHLPRCLPNARSLSAMGVMIVGLLSYGSYWVVGNFPLSVDERMVVFDMAVFNGFDLATPLAESWRPYAKALNPSLLLNEHMPMGLVSSYLPMNALLRLAFSKLADPAFFNPLLALAGGAALLDISRRKFGHDGPTCCVTLLIYALSAQMLVNAMTVYSMTAHMALNLIWLAAYLRGGRLGHSIAILTGFVATGLHQLAFHPLFVAPFLFCLLRRREWKLALLYGAAYSAIILWWAYYPVLAGQETANALVQAPNNDLFGRISAAFAERRGDTLITTILNLLRFLAWQHLALLPLLAAAVGVAVRDRGFPAILLLGISLWLGFITVVIPFQGHGWGYRYLHPYLGSFALLAGYGYRELRGAIGTRIDGFVLTLSGVTALVTIPILLTATYRFTQPYLALERLIAKQREPMVLIDTYSQPATDGRWAPNAIENVRNLPDLSNRPLRFSSRNMNPELLAGLCRRGQVRLIARSDQQSVDFGGDDLVENPSFAALIDNVQQNMPHCLVATAGDDPHAH